MNLQGIERIDLAQGREALFVADETDHVQWIRLATVMEFGAEEPHVPFMGRCDICDARHHTTAHLDHTPENVHPANLRAMCQSCHLRYDREHHAETRRRTLAAVRAGRGELPLIEVTA